MEGKSYSQLKETIVMIFFNVNKEEDCMKLRTIEMPKLDVKKPLEEMNEQEKMIYYFLNCHFAYLVQWR